MSNLSSFTKSANDHEAMNITFPVARRSYHLRHEYTLVVLVVLFLPKKCPTMARYTLHNFTKQTLAHLTTSVINSFFAALFSFILS